MSHPSMLYQDDEYIYIKYFKHWRSGKIIYASDYGLKCFKIPKRRKK